MKRYILGSDEVGLGPLAGPLVVCATLVPAGWGLPGLQDSKALSKKKICLLAEQLRGIPHEIVQVEAPELDLRGLRWGLEHAHTRAIEALLARAPVPPDEIDIIVDGNAEHCPTIANVQYIVQADKKVPAVQAGAILAKYTRDQIMHAYHDVYPEFGFRLNAGYGTRLHLAALKFYGASPIHRRLCAPVRRFE